MGSPEEHSQNVPVQASPTPDILQERSRGCPPHMQRTPGGHPPLSLPSPPRHPQWMFLMAVAFAHALQAAMPQIFLE